MAESLESQTFIFEIPVWKSSSDHCSKGHRLFLVQPMTDLVHNYANWFVSCQLGF